MSGGESVEETRTAVDDELKVGGEDGEEKEGSQHDDATSGIASSAGEATAEKTQSKLALEDEDEKRKRDAELLPEQKEENLNKAKRLRQQGNEIYRNGRHEEASEIYRTAVSTCPIDESQEMAILYSNWAASLVSMSRFDDAVSCLNRAIVHDPNYLKAYLRRAKVYEQLDKLDEALEDYKKVVERDPGVAEARRACMELPEKINQRNERLKADMIDKLKQLGNLVLRPFGLSTDNFELKQDPSTGSYSVNMKK